MHRKAYLIISLFTTCGIFALGCSEATNPLGYLVLPQSQASHFYLMAEAQYYLDEGDYEKAIEFGEKAYEIDPGYEENAIILGFAYMAIAGVDPLSLTQKLMEQEGEQGEGASALTQETDANDTSNPLEPLEGLLGLDQAELDRLTLEGNQVTLEDGTTISGAPSSGVFVDYPVLLPKTAAEARASGPTLTLLGKAIKVICPFIKEQAKIISPISDERHNAENCPPSEKELRSTGRSHFIWAFAHLTEAIAFNSVVLYDPSGKGANIVRRSDALKDPSSVPLLDYISAIDELADTLEFILPTAEDKTQGSMLFAMVNDLEATSRGFDQIPGTPASLTSSIRSALAKLEQQKAEVKAAGVTSEVEASSSALKGSLTETLGSNLKSQIEARDAAGEFSAEDKAQVCASYASISSDAIESCSS